MAGCTRVSHRTAEVVVFLARVSSGVTPTTTTTTTTTSTTATTTTTATSSTTTATTPPLSPCSSLASLQDENTVAQLEDWAAAASQQRPARESPARSSLHRGGQVPPESSAELYADDDEQAAAEAKAAAAVAAAVVGVGKVAPVAAAVDAAAGRGGASGGGEIPFSTSPAPRANQRLRWALAGTSRVSLDTGASSGVHRPLASSCSTSTHRGCPSRRYWRYSMSTIPTFGELAAEEAAAEAAAAAAMAVTAGGARDLPTLSAAVRILRPDTRRVT